jgi:hypothetical protein
MTATPQPTWAPAPRPNPWSAGRIIALVLGLLVLLFSTLLLMGGGALLSADLTGRSDDGYLTSPEDTFTGPGYALVSERIELSTGADWVPLSAALGTARIEVTGTVPGSDVFIGIAPVTDVTAYLEGVERTVIDDLGADAGPGTLVPGGAPSGPPGDQDFWTEQAAGRGTEQVSWVPAEGDWMLVVMNADGSAGVSVDARIGATFPALTGFGWGLLVAGLLCLAIGVVLLVLAIRRPSDARRGMPPSGWQVPTAPVPAGPPSWAPPSSGPPVPPSSGPPSSGTPVPPWPPSSGPRVPPWVPPAQADRATAPDGQPSPERTPKQS